MSGKRTPRGEFELIAELFSPLSKGAPGALGLTDDVALLEVTPGHQLVVTTDTLIAGVHFRPDDPAGLIARKALRVNLSDLAAKGAHALGFVHALALNPEIDDMFLESYAAGLAEDVDEFGVPLLGGDTTSGPGPLAITITAFGEVENGGAILRSGGRPGDVVCVTGTIGDAAIGLACLNNATVQIPSFLADELKGRYRIPQPRLTAGRALRGLATAALDISDGLVADLNHLCTSSGVAAILDREKIPLSSGARAAVGQDPRLWDLILGGGDDYELAFTAPANRVSELQTLASGLMFPLTQIGVLAEGAGVTVLSAGQPVNLSAKGYRHR